MTLIENDIGDASKAVGGVIYGLVVDADGCFDCHVVYSLGSSLFSLSSFRIPKLNDLDIYALG